MSNLSTVKAVTDNILSVLKVEGINFSCRTYDSKEQIPASIIPFGELFYLGEDFEYMHSGSYGYVEARFRANVTLDARDPVQTIQREQGWVHSLRSALTVSALNSGELASTKSVSKVTISNMDIENKERFSVLSFKISVRYRES